MPRPQFSIRTLLWLTLVVAIGCAAWPTARDWVWESLWPNGFLVERHRRVVDELWPIEMQLQNTEPQAAQI